MRYNKIRKMDIADGPGVRVSVFMQGCSFHCKNCFNAETWDYEGGKEFNVGVVNEILDLCEEDYIKGLSVLGGEPMNPVNIKGTEMLVKAFKERFPEKTVWVWSGYTFEDYLSKQDAIKYVDVIVDGQYKDELHNPKLSWRGSENQRVIDVPKSLKSGKIELFCD